jgi:hypothetical protein
MSAATTKEASGRFVLRVEPELHDLLRRAAADHGMSLNSYCINKLALPTTAAGYGDGLVEALIRVSRVVGDQLLGVVVHGSWARGRATASSDVDLLVVVSHDLPLSRDLYRAWDQAPVAWEGHPVEPSFVHLPDPSEIPSGLWAEIAMDGIILFERELQVSRWLIRVREFIANGELLRRVAHGQPYWVHEKGTPR